MSNEPHIKAEVDEKVAAAGTNGIGDRWEWAGLVDNGKVLTEEEEAGGTITEHTRKNQTKNKH